MKTYRGFHRAFNLVLILIFLTGLLGVQPASAQTEPPGDKPSLGPDGLRYGYNPDTGNLNFVGGDAVTPLLDAAQTVGALSAEDAGMAVLAQFAPEFGLRSAAKDLRLERMDERSDGATFRYQQQYDGIPVLGGELLLNRDEAGNFVSLNGEVSPELKLRTTRPAISRQRALNTALAGMKSWYGLSASKLQVSEPALWIYDASIFEPVDSYPVLVWRMEITPVEGSAAPVNELVLVNAANGRIALHFNQVDRGLQPQEEPETPIPTEETPLPQEEEPPVEETPTPEPPFEEDLPDDTDGTGEQPGYDPQIEASSGVTWYVAYWGIDTNDCTTPATPCETINYVHDKAGNNDIIRVAAGIYTADIQGTIVFKKVLAVLGGWSPDFRVQDGYTTLDGQNKTDLVHVYSGSSTNYNVSLMSRMILTRGNSNSISENRASALVVNEGAYFTIRDSSIHHNQGVAVLLYRAKEFSAINVTIAENRSETTAGLRIIRTRYATLKNVTIANNSGNGSGGGLSAVGVPSEFYTPIIRISDTIIANNTASSAPDCYSNPYVQWFSYGTNLIENRMGCVISTFEKHITGKEPGLDALTPQGFYPLLPNSPALDSGSYYWNGSFSICDEFDHAGTARPVDGNRDGRARCDVGAHENIKPSTSNRLELWNGSQQTARVFGDYVPLQVRAIGQNRLPLAGAPVIFTAPADGQSGTFDGGATQAEVVTNAEGIATAPTFTAGGLPGFFSIKATLTNPTNTVLFALENYEPFPATLKVFAGDGQSTKTQHAFPQQFQALLRDQYGRPIADAAVTFTAPDSGPSGRFADTSMYATTLLTGSDGVATTSVFTANEQDGVYFVTARADGLDTELTFRVANGVHLYISPTGSDTLGAQENTCTSPETPCQTYAHTSKMIIAGNTTIYYQSGTYAEPITVSKDVDLSGGWDANFLAQDGKSVLVPTKQNQTGINAINVKTDITGFTVMGFETGIRILENRNFFGTEAVISNCAILNNYTGVSINRSSVLLQNCTISNNDTGISTGPIGVDIRITHSTIAENTNIGVYLSDGYRRPFTIQNNIFARNGTSCFVNTGTITSGGYNIFDTQQSCKIGGNSGSTVISSSYDLYATDPKISRLIGGTHHALAASSPAIDAADPTADCPPVDIRNAQRPSNGVCDIGSFEYTLPGPAVALFRDSTENQVTLPGMEFPNKFKVLALDSMGSLAYGDTITFRAPDSGASAVFGSAGTTFTTTTGDDGTAETPVIYANQHSGSYTVTAALIDDTDSVSFQLGNRVSEQYVDPINGDDSAGNNDCFTANTPCKTVRNAAAHTTSSGLILLASGTVPLEKPTDRTVISLERDMILSGGWDSTFTSQDGHTVVSSNTTTATGLEIKQNARVLVDRMDFANNNLGIYNNGGNVSLRNGRLYQNSIAIYNLNKSMDVSNSAITNNKHGISNGGNLLLTNVNLSGNICRTTATSSCSGTPGLTNGGLVTTAKTVLINVTVANNHSYSKYDYYIDREDTGGISNVNGTVQIINSIVANNHNNNSDDCYGTITSLGHNLIGKGGFCQIQAAEGDVIGTWDHPVDPVLGYNGSYGSDFETVPLLSGSPAIDSADPAACPATDLRGVARPAGAGCDMGAFEGSMEGTTAPRIITFTADSTDNLPFRWLCESPQEDCTGGEIPEADLVHSHTLKIYQMYYDLHGRRSMDDAGMPVISTVHSGAALNNAFWDGRQLAYGTGYVVDDVVAHEYTHGVTEYTSHLFYYQQSGAISESLSDMWGEYYDQTNGLGNDTLEVKWLAAEDLPKGAIRSMSHPPQFGDPDSMSSKLYWRGYGDNGGVHTNSGVNNKAVYLMVDGGVFNKLTIAPIGWEKTLAIYYHTQTNLLTSGAGYDDLYNALNQSCIMLTGGKEGITSEDCGQVRKALDAVQMSKSHKSGFNPSAPDCPSNSDRVSENLYFEDFEDFENGDQDWIFAPIVGKKSHWTIAPGADHFHYAASGHYALFGDDAYTETIGTSSYAAMNTGITIPKKGKTFLFFKHAYAFEYGTYRGKLVYIDGGMLEYTVDDGNYWQDAKSLFSAGQNYPGKLFLLYYPGYNPLAGKYAFRGESHGYVDSRYDLSKLAGKTVRFRWKMGVDSNGSSLGWLVDDVAIYSCVGKPGVPKLSSPSHNGLITNYQPRLNWGDTANTVSYDLQIALDPAFTNLTVNETGLTISEYTLPAPLEPNTRYYWRARAINAAKTLSNWSSVRSFRTAMLAPVLDAPGNGSAVDSRQPAFSWSADSGATSYSLQVSKYANFKSTLLSISVKTNTYVPTKNLYTAPLYYWRVRANGANPSTWSEVFTFTAP